YKPSQRGETTPVRPQHQFDEDRLKEYLSAKSFVSNDDTLVVRQYSAGQSNPTFLIQTPSKSYVLRKKPPGALLPGAHKVDREYRVQKALHSSGFPVPRPLLHCTDIDVIGTEFYLMEHIVQGRIFWDLRLPGVIPAERAALYVAAVEVLAKLHSLDLASLKLDGYGKGIGYCRRQVSTWTKQYTASSHRDIPAMNELSAWLMTGIPTVDDLISVYRRCRGIPSTLPSLNFYLALSLFKMAGIAQGVHARHLLGNASAPNAAELGQCVEPLAVLALQLAQRFVIQEAGLFLQTAKGRAVLRQVKDFMRQHVLPVQKEVTEYYIKYAHSPLRWNTPQIIDDLKVEAGLWNLFLPAASGLTQLDYAYIAEETGRCLFAPEVFNCQAPGKHPARFHTPSTLPTSGCSPKLIDMFSLSGCRVPLG
uniref:Aminoglycoside phosphotransferase domain-containing protein n=1 Tax=Hippocampus comes TaxID=109280 RepID=A0A3Q2Z939_HIPCM